MRKDVLYWNTETDEILTYDEFRTMAAAYIANNEWEDGGKPTVPEVMENMDNVIEYEEF